MGIRNYLGRNFKKQRGKDKISPKRRSLLMSKIASKNTKFEKDFIILLKKQTKRIFLTNTTSIRGKPDIVFQKQKLCVFLDSDFWHGWQYSRWRHLLKNEFWKDKIHNNRERDKKTSRYLRRHGWTVVRIWEHEIKNSPENSIKKILNQLPNKSLSFN